MSMTKPKIFIDGEAGTTGLEIRMRLANRDDIEVISIDANKRKDVDERRRLLNAADISILCLPDDAARDAVSMVENPRTKILDASTAFRTHPDWVYGFAELTQGQAGKITTASRVSNPGCYPTGALSIIRPLRDAHVIGPEASLTINAVSGYSGGGKELIELCENPETRRDGRGGPFCLYGLDGRHKHIPEIKKYGDLTMIPIFLPSYSHAFYRGMLVHVSFRLQDMNIPSVAKEYSLEYLQDLYTAHYKGHSAVTVKPLIDNCGKGFVLTPLACCETNDIHLQLFANRETGVCVVTAILDNLGKGASGAAIQNLDLMLSSTKG